jgi:hypothetical protein
MAHRIQSDRSGAVFVVADALPVVHVLTATSRSPTRAESLLRISRDGASRILPVGSSPVTVGARAFTPCAYDGAPFRDPPPPAIPTAAPLAPPVTLDVVALNTLPVGSMVLAPVNLATSGAWDRGTIVGNGTHVRDSLAGGSLRTSIALGRRVTWIPVARLQGDAGVAIFEGERLRTGGAFNDAPVIELDASLPSGGVRFRGSDGTTFEAPGVGVLESFELPLPDQAGRVWIIEAADRSTLDPEPDDGTVFVCVHPTFSG